MSRFGWVAFAWISLAAAGCGTTNEDACTRAGDCATGMACIAGQCTNATTCVSSRQCPDLVCDATLGMCVECVTAADCDAPLVCVDSVCGTAMVGIDSGADAGMDAFVGVDAFVAPRDVGVGDATHDTYTPRDAGIDADAFAVPDAFDFPDAYVAPDAVVLPDAYVIPDAFVPNDTSGCDPGLRYCSGHCVDTTTDSMNCSNCGIACPGGYACISSGCMCITRCGGVCSDLANDSNNCGACGHACAPGDYCRGSVCLRPACATGETSTCGGCRNLATDPSNCGGCGNACPSGTPYCRGGTCSADCSAPLTSTGLSCRDSDSDPDYCSNQGARCQPNELCEMVSDVADPYRGAFARPICVAQCSPGMTTCNRSCVNRQSNPLNCGSCGHACAAGQSCVAGLCSTCQSGESLCGLGCVDEQTDPNNCGGCGNVCGSSAPYCRGGTCSASCSAPLTSTGLSCRDSDSDPDYCSNQGARCQPNELCEMVSDVADPYRGAFARPICVAQCSPGMTTCNRSCVNTQLSMLNCGSCGHACAPDQYCAAGVCSNCAVGQHLCGLGCVDEQTDPNNCGGCGNVCASSAPYCRGGTCSASCSAPLTSTGLSCRDSDSDPDYCSNQGARCQPNELCEMVSDVADPYRGAFARPICVAQCSPGMTTCNRSCVNTQLSMLNCGSCGHACAPDQYCAAGVCSNCAVGQHLCGLGCVDEQTDPNNCGGCGNVCASSAPYCRGGTCSASCSAPLTSTGLSCRDSDSDPDYCSNQGARCQPNELCEMVSDVADPYRGAFARPICVAQCSPGMTTCNRSCVNTQLSMLNCGSCGHACAPDQYCAAGVCSNCAVGQHLCGLGCVDEQTDPNNCGGCGNVCASSAPYCRGGTCSASCSAPLTSTGLSCRDSDSDPDYCSNQGARCQPNELCEMVSDVADPYRGAFARPICVAQCSPGMTTCNRSCVNTQLSMLNCGSCGHACAVDEYCVAGVCAHSTIE